MIRKLLKTALVALALLTGSVGVRAQIDVTAEGVNYGFDDATIAPFTEGTIQSGNASIGNVLTTGNSGKAVAYFKANGSEENIYTLSENEKVTFSFVAYQGWNSSNSSANVSIKDPDGKELIAYTYNHKDCNVTDVRIGGATVSGFVSFFGQGKANNNNRKNHANTYTSTGNQNFNNEAGWNPEFTFSISSSGFVSFSCKYDAKSFDVIYKGNVSNTNGVKLKSFEITDELKYANSCIGIDNLSVKSVIEQTYAYAVNYKFGEDIVYSVSGEAPENTEISIDRIVYDNKKNKYYTIDETLNKLTVSSVVSNNIMDVEVREAYDYNYTIKSNLGNTISTGIGVEGETIFVPYPRYINIDGSLYAKDVTNKEYRISFVITENNHVETLDYTDANIKNVVYYSEGEKIPSATATSAGANMVVRSSNAACGYATSDIDLITLTPGKYKVITAVYSNSSGGTVIDFVYGEKTLTHKVENANNMNILSQEITVNRNCTFTWKASGDSKNGLDYIYIQKIATDLATVSSVGYATYSPSSNVTVPAEEEGIKVYRVTVNAEQTGVELNPVSAGSVIAAGTGYVLEAAEGSYPFAVSNDEVSEIGENALKVSDGNVTVGNDDKIFVLAQRNNGSVGFSIVNAGVTIPAGKAYLQLSAEAKVSFLSFGDDATAIESVETNNNSGNGEYYTLQGVRTSAPVKGLYIINGKKVVVK